MEQNSFDIFLKKIKKSIFVLLFILCFLNLNNYKPKQFSLNDLPLPEIKPIIQEEIVEVIEVEKKTIPRVPKIKPKEPVKPLPEIEILPLPTDEISLQTIPYTVDNLTVLEDMEKLLANRPPQYKMHKFHISPIEYKPNPKEWIIPGSMLAVGILATNTDKYRDLIPGMRNNPQNQTTPFDDKAQLVPSASLFLLDIFGKEKHNPIDQLFLMAFSYGFTVLPVRQIKDNYTAERPYGGNHSFPSGHTATAFVGAHMIYKEFKDSNPWLAYSGYVMGTVVASARVIHNKHWVCDVMAGAAIAILATELAYIVYIPIRNFVTNGVNKLFDKYILLTPIAQPGTFGVNLSIQF